MVCDLALEPLWSDILHPTPIRFAPTGVYEGREQDQFQNKPASDAHNELRFVVTTALGIDPVSFARRGVDIIDVAGKRPIFVVGGLIYP